MASPMAGAAAQLQLVDQRLSAHLKRRHVVELQQIRTTAVDAHPVTFLDHPLLAVAGVTVTARSVYRVPVGIVDERRKGTRADSGRIRDPHAQTLVRLTIDQSTSGQSVDIGGDQVGLAGGPSIRCRDLVDGDPHLGSADILQDANQPEAEILEIEVNRELGDRDPERVSTVTNLPGTDRRRVQH